MENAVPAAKHNAKIDAKAAGKVAISPLLTTDKTIKAPVNKNKILFVYTKYC
jgi:hypothetical protein